MQDRLDYPRKEEWELRQQWFDEQNDLYCIGNTYFLSEQACALCYDVEIAFCAGAWVAVIVLAMAVIDSQLRDIELFEFKGSTKKLLEELDLNDFQRLRERRNALVHVNCDNPAITMDEQTLNQEKLEEEARNAVKLMFKALYLTPGT